MLIGQETLSNTSENGLLKLSVTYGMTRMPESADAVAAGFRDLAKYLREFADAVDRINATAALLGKGSA